MSLTKYIPPVRYTIFECGYIGRLIKTLKMKVAVGSKPEDCDDDQSFKGAKVLKKYNPRFIVHYKDIFADKSVDLDLKETKNDLSSIGSIISDKCAIVFESSADPAEIYQALKEVCFCEIYDLEKITYYTRMKGEESELFCCIVEVGCESG